MRLRYLYLFRVDAIPEIIMESTYNGPQVVLDNDLRIVESWDPEDTKNINYIPLGYFSFALDSFVRQGSELNVLDNNSKLVSFETSYISKKENIIFEKLFKNTVIEELDIIYNFVFEDYLNKEVFRLRKGVFDYLLKDGLVTFSRIVYPNKNKQIINFRLTDKGQKIKGYIKLSIFGTIFFQLSGVLLNNWFAN